VHHSAIHLRLPSTNGAGVPASEPTFLLF